MLQQTWLTEFDGWGDWTKHVVIDGNRKEQDQPMLMMGINQCHCLMWMPSHARFCHNTNAHDQFHSNPLIKCQDMPNNHRDTAHCLAASYVYKALQINNSYSIINK